MASKKYKDKLRAFLKQKRANVIFYKNGPKKPLEEKEKDEKNNSSFINQGSTPQSGAAMPSPVTSALALRNAISELTSQITTQRDLIKEQLSKIVEQNREIEELLAKGDSFPKKVVKGLEGRPLLKERPSRGFSEEPALFPGEFPGEKECIFSRDQLAFLNSSLPAYLKEGRPLSPEELAAFSAPAPLSRHAYFNLFPSEEEYQQWTREGRFDGLDLRD